MKHARTSLASHKMRGMIDPYTLGFLISIIGGSIAFSVHSEKPQYDETSDTIQISNQSDSSTHLEDDLDPR